MKQSLTKVKKEREREIAKATNWNQMSTRDECIKTWGKILYHQGECKKGY